MNSDLCVGLAFSTAYFIYCLVMGLTVFHHPIVPILGLVPYFVIVGKYFVDKKKLNEELARGPV